MEFFTATRKLKKFFFVTTRDVWCVHHWWHSTHRYDIQVLATHVRQHGCFLLAQTPSFSKLFIPRTNGLVCRQVLCVLWTKCTLHCNHRLTVWYSNTQNDCSLAAAIFSTHKLASPSGRNVNYDEKRLTGGKKCLEMFLPCVQVS